MKLNDGLLLTIPLTDVIERVSFNKPPLVPMERKREGKVFFSHVPKQKLPRQAYSLFLSLSLSF